VSVPRPAEPSTLIFAILRSPAVATEEILDSLKGRFATPCAVSDPAEFTQTDYYRNEMGGELERFYCSVEGFWDAGRLADIKLASNHLERRWSQEQRRRVNLDPGLLDLTHLVLATGKPAAHRVYLGQGIHGEVEYIFEKRSYRPLPWTYPDYREAWVIDFFNRVRRAHRAARKLGG